jgi:hypothetical protein
MHRSKPEPVEVLAEARPPRADPLLAVAAAEVVEAVAQQHPNPVIPQQRAAKAADVDAARRLLPTPTEAACFGPKTAA